MFNNTSFRFLLAANETVGYGIWNGFYHILTPVLYPKKDLGRRKALLARIADHMFINLGACLQHYFSIEVIFLSGTHYVNFFMLAVVCVRFVALRRFIQKKNQQ
jgi:hypothetical protein